MTSPVQVFIVSLKKRAERLESVLSQFQYKPEFYINVIEAISHPVGAVGLWKTIIKIINLPSVSSCDYIVICEDDHVFTKNYSKSILFDCIKKAKKLEADILIGGPSWVSSTIQADDYLHWVESFTGLQFIVVFQKLYHKILNAFFSDEDAVDLWIGNLTDNKYFIYPFISVQKDFGYSDVTVRNNTNGRITTLFAKCAESISLLLQVDKYYKEISVSNSKFDSNGLTIPTYVINLPERTERKKHIIGQFEDKIEFDLQFIEACRHTTGAVGLWLSIRKIISIAIANDDDVIIICEDDHEFTADYTKEYLLDNVIEAAEQGVDFLSGGCGGFGVAVPVTSNRFWVNTILSTQFIVIYKTLFQKILDERFDDNVKADLLFSELTSSKIVLYPFVSIQKDFGYSDVTPIHNAVDGLVVTLFNKSRNRLDFIQQAYLQHCKK